MLSQEYSTAPDEWWTVPLELLFASQTVVECIDRCNCYDNGSITEWHALRTCCWWPSPTIIKWAIPWREERFWYWDLKRWKSDTSDLRKTRNRRWWFCPLAQSCHNCSIICLNVWFSSTVTVSLVVESIGVSAGFTIVLVFIVIDTLTLDLVKYGCSASLPQTNPRKLTRVDVKWTNLLGVSQFYKSITQLLIT